MKQILYLSIVVVLFFSSCRSYRQIPYFQNLEKEGIINEDIKNYSVLRIQQDDILAINVSSLNPEASAVFNTGNTSSVATLGGGTSSIAPASALNGFLVDQNGAIQLPLVGSVKVAGLSTAEARALIQTKLLTYLKEPIVTLRITNFKVSVLGDVAHPGVFPVQSERISIPEALSMSGDLNITGMRKNILLIRENEGKRSYVRIDLNDKNIFNSPYYYLKTNDVLYVQPSNAKYASVDTNYRNLSILLSTISILLVIISKL